MELITNIIVEYLKYNKRLCVPKLGTFIVKQASGEIKFSDLMRNDDGVLCSLLLAYGVKELEAKGMMDRFVFEVHHAVAVDGKFVIATLGEFTADINNTITFKQAAAPTQPQQVTPQKQGGRIKPPIEVLEQRLTEHERLHPKQQSEKQTKSIDKRKAKAQRGEEQEISLGKPEAYLRGLKYDSNKNKKREEGGRSSRPGGSGKWLLIILAVVALGVAIGVIFWPEKRHKAASLSVEAPRVEACDSLLNDTIPSIDSMLIDGAAPRTETTNK